ncbi:unnamed protein product, partial [Choristocarpus tenellus]
QCHALRGLSELPLPHSSSTEGEEGGSLKDDGLPPLPCQALSEAIRGRVAHTQIEHAACVRAEAAVSLALWQNAHAPPHAGGFGETKEARAASWKGLYCLLEAFAERYEQRVSYSGGFGSSDGSAGGGEVGEEGIGGVESLLLPNWFDDPVDYRLKKALVWAIANVRARDGCTPQESVELLINALNNNDNSENSCSDDYYVAQV